MLSTEILAIAKIHKMKFRILDLFLFDISLMPDWGLVGYGECHYVLYMFANLRCPGRAQMFICPILLRRHIERVPKIEVHKWQLNNVALHQNSI